MKIDEIKIKKSKTLKNLIAKNKKVQEINEDENKEAKKKTKSN